MPRSPRLLELLRVLAGAKKALHPTHLIKLTGISRTSLYVLLKHLKNGGFLQAVPHGKETHFRLSAAVALGSLSREQIAALLFAHQSVAPLRGTRLARDLDALVAPLSREEGARSLVRLAPPSPLIDTAIFNTVLEAYEKKRRLRCLYQSSKDEAPRWRTVDTLLFYAEGDQPYAEVVDVELRQQRTFKLVRMSAARLLEQPVDAYPEFDPVASKRHARKVWDAPLVDVVVRLAPDKARFANEWPLKRDDQTVTSQPDGAVLVKARLSGTEEALKWVLSWGSGACVISPAQLREAHQRELHGALRGYQDSHDEASRNAGRRRPGGAGEAGKRGR